MKNRIYKYMTSVSQSMYIDKLHDIVTKYNNTCHSTTKMNHVDVKSSTYIEETNKKKKKKIKEINDKNPNFKIGGIVRISKYKNIFAKSLAPNWSKEVFVIKKVKNPVNNNDVYREKLLELFYENELQRTKSKRI